MEAGMNKIVESTKFLLPHCNPMIMEKNSDRVRSKPRTLGFDSLIDSMHKDINEYFEDDGQYGPSITIVKGETGAGKTAFALNLIDKLKKEPGKFLSAHKEITNDLPVFTSMINAESELVYLNVWRPLFQMMFTYFCQNKNQKKQKWLANLIVKTKNTRYTNILCEILGVSAKAVKKCMPPEFMNAEQEQPIYSPIYFVHMPNYKEEANENIIEFLTNFFKIMIGELDDVSHWVSFDRNHSAQ
jgi:hypothetical protein